MRILCLWLPNWPVQRAVQAGRGSAAERVVLSERDRRGRLTVAACSAAAAAEGIFAGMPLAEASSVARQSRRAGRYPPAPLPESDRCASRQPDSAASRELPRPLWKSLDRWADRVALEELAVSCAAFSPRIAVADPVAADAPPGGEAWSDSLLLDVTGLDRLFGSEAELAAALRRHVAQWGYRARLAAADSVGAAWAFARHIASVANEQIAIVPSARIGDALSALPVSALRISPEAAQRLMQLGVEQIGQLTSLPREALRSRVGSEVLVRLDQALGLLAEPLSGQRSGDTPGASWNGSAAVRSSEALERLLERLCTKTAEQLGRIDRGALRLTCRVRDAEGVVHALPVAFYRPTANVRHWCELIQLQWERLDLAAGVVAIEVAVEQAVPLTSVQQELFDLDAAGSMAKISSIRQADIDRQWGILLERLAGRLGRRAVVRARQVADPQPEWGVRWESWLAWEATAARSSSPPRRRRRPAAAALAGGDAVEDAARPRPEPCENGAGCAAADSVPGQSGLAQSHLPGQSGLAQAHLPGQSGLAQAHLPGQRPLRLHAPPRVLGAAESGVGSCPERLECDQTWHEVVAAEGPERIETGWWRRAAVRRDYWRVGLRDGRRWWIFYDLRARRWCLHGEFG